MMHKQKRWRINLSLNISQTEEEYIHDAVVKRACEKSFAFFVRYIFKEYYNVGWKNNWHHDKIIDVITNLELRSIENAVINIPPRYGKTELMILWIVHTLARNPRAQFIYVSYSEKLAHKSSAQIRDIIKSPAFQKFWQIKMRDSTDAKGLWLTEEGGGLLADSSGGAVTGFGAGTTTWKMGEPFDGAIIIDDPHKAGDANSEAMRLAVNEKISGTMHSRKNHSQVPIVIVMQRLHEEDASGYALSGNVMGDKFHHLKLPAIDEDGKALWEWKHTIEQLNMMQVSQPMVFAGQYQQEPYVLGGMVFNMEWFKRYDMPPRDVVQVVHSWDTAYKADQHNDPSACTIWHVTDTEHYLMEVVHLKAEYPELRKKILELAERDKPNAILIEDKASGQSLIQELRESTRYPVIAVKPEGDKETRARVSSATIEAGKVRLPERATWLPVFERELMLFPNAKNDDIVDSVSQYINWYNRNGGGADAEYVRLMESLYG